MKKNLKKNLLHRVCPVCASAPPRANNIWSPFAVKLPFQHLLYERLTSLGKMGAPRVTPLNPSETVVLSRALSSLRALRGAPEGMNGLIQSLVHLVCPTWDEAWNRVTLTCKLWRAVTPEVMGFSSPSSHTMVGALSAHVGEKE